MSSEPLTSSSILLGEGHVMPHCLCVVGIERWKKEMTYHHMCQHHPQTSFHWLWLMITICSHQKACSERHSHCPLSINNSSFTDLCPLFCFVQSHNFLGGSVPITSGLCCVYLLGFHIFLELPNKITILIGIYPCMVCYTICNGPSIWNFEVHQLSKIYSPNCWTPFMRTKPSKRWPDSVFNKERHASLYWCWMGLWGLGAFIPHDTLNVVCGGWTDVLVCPQSLGIGFQSPLQRDVHAST